MKGPTERTLNELRRQGYRADVVEQWNSYTRKRKDLFGIIDVVAIGGGETVGVQCTSYSNVWSRVQKMEDSETIGDLREAGWKLLIWGWHKKKGRWTYREVNVS